MSDARGFVVSVLVIVAAALASDVCAAPVVVETALGVVPKGAQPASRVFSRDLGRVAQIACAEASCAVYVNGVPGPTFESIVPRTLRFAGGRVVAYAGKRGTETFIVVEGRQLVVPSAAVLAPPTFALNPAVSDDGARAMAILEEGGAKKVRLFDLAKDNQLDWGPYDDAMQPQFGADGRAVFLAKRGSQMFVVVDGQEGPAYDTVGLVTLSPDGKRVAHTARKDGVSRYSVDGVLGEPLGITSPFTFSPDSKRYGYSTATPDAPTRYVLDGEPTPGPGTGTVTSPFVFSQDSRHVGYIVVNDKDQLAYSIDGVIGPYYGRVSDLAFWSSAAKSKVAYSREGLSGKRAIAYTGGTTPTYHPPGTPLALAWSADGRSFSYVAAQGPGELAKLLVYVNGKRATPAGYGATGPAAFATSGNQSAHIARSSSGTFALIVDSKKRLVIKGTLMSAVQATKDGFAFVVERDGERYRIEWRPR